MSKPRLSVVRGVLFLGGVVLIGIAGKVVFLGMGAGTFKLANWELGLLVVVGALMILIGWQRTPSSSADTEDDDLNERADSGDDVST